MNKIILAALLVILASCQAKQSADTKALSGAATTADPVSVPSSSTNVSPAPTGTGDPTTVAVIPTTLGGRNFDEINSTMESVTGVTGNKNVISRFTLLKAQLPTDNDIKSFSFSAQGAVTVLAAEYCNALIGTTTYPMQMAAALGNFNLNNPPTVAFAGTAPMMLAQSLIMKFWGSGYANNANLAASEAAVAKLLTDLSTGLTNNTTTTKNSVIGACTSVLASAPVSTY
ncbi:MAG: hypothetical protein ACXVBE_08925 [Bdellovibrionota bacterium]